MSNSINRLIAVMEKLRDPQGGCPWDLAQSYRSIAHHTLEEAYEVVEAIETGDFSGLREELGDLLFHVVYHCQLAAEDGRFTFDAIAGEAADKMIRRHPHVFAEADVADAAAQTAAWEAQKARERSDNGGSGTLDGVIAALPALTRAMKLQSRAARVGFDWPAARDVIAKVREELGELEDVLDGTEDREAMLDEVGDLLFSCVNLTRKLGIEPETALRQGNRKFERRFRLMESLLARRGVAPGAATLEQMERCWEEAKAQERPGPGEKSSED